MSPSSDLVAAGGLLLLGFLSFGLGEAWRRWALRRGIMDIPGHRSSHVTPTPRGGGVGMAAAMFLGSLVFGPGGREGLALASGIALLAGVGLVDDLRPLRPPSKLLGQGLGAAAIAFALPVPLDALGLGSIGFPVAGMLAAFALVLLAVNAWNFMDGINGIASLAAAAVGLCVAVLGPAGVNHFALLLVLACLAFLPLNFPKAKVFMGDCGSHALGASVAVLILLAFRTSDTGVAAWVGLAAASPFLVDVLGTLVRRFRDGEPITQAHRRHLYQCATRSGYSHPRVAIAYALWMLASGGLALALTCRGVDASGAALGLTLANLMIFAFAVHRLEPRVHSEGTP